IFPVRIRTAAPPALVTRTFNGKLPARLRERPASIAIRPSARTRHGAPAGRCPRQVTVAPAAPLTRTTLRAARPVRRTTTLWPSVGCGAATSGSPPSEGGEAGVGVGLGGAGGVGGGGTAST